jgi:hypothetical protein
VDDSDSVTESAEQDADTRIKASEEQPEQEWKPAKDFSTKDSSAKFNSDRASIPGGKPCISGGEQLAMHCPNWFHAGFADVASMAVTGLDAMAVHGELMVHCTDTWGQYSSTGVLCSCAQAIKQVAPDISASLWVDLSLALQAVLVATKAIHTLTADQKLNFEDQHWLYLGRYRPQVAQMAHALALPTGQGVRLQGPPAAPRGAVGGE